MDKVVHKKLSYKIVGLLFENHKTLGRYKNEKQYADHFEQLLNRENIKYVREYRFEDSQYGQNKIRCICDFIIDDKIILEFKAKNFITTEDYYQVKRYLTTLNLQLGILVNFRQNRIVPKRILNSQFYEHNSNLQMYSNITNE
ncbi:GxxExxY protein [Patescibacteria group bacterium]|nr:GxxExxY protein [Patescibacteria group bacterium]MBU1160208.1 GxxExxY protein [Patescibacteria group bacterium]MBU1350214.1 GxxExxY protein [Patescibacteria group bacterium]MBU1421425.1 GxxExxY protein [Patescibacteria group bacterium]MBU1684316.1 GxxExxY protein [Patescibacteria group bacterium]